MSAGPMGGFAYAQVRLQARLGAATDTADLQRLRATQDLPALLHVARSLPLARHVERLAPSMGVHELERRLREEWYADVHEVARWQPAPWRAAIAWLHWLPLLPLLQKLARGGRAPPWARSDPVIGALIAVEPRERAMAIASTPCAPFAPAFTDQDVSVVEAWLAHWRALWPDDGGATRGLQKVVARIREVDRALRTAPAQGTTQTLLDQLGQQLVRAFRRHPLSPTAAVAYLGLDAIALMALRGAVAERAICTGRDA
jgi:hypothetical protein